MGERNIPLSDDVAKKLADALMRRRIELGIRSARQLGSESGLDYRTITGLEAQRQGSVSRNTLAVLELQLQWPAGYLTALIDNAYRPTETVVELSIPDGADPEAVERARQVAQATFNATLREIENI